MQSIRHVLILAITTMAVVAVGAGLTAGSATATEDEAFASAPKKKLPAPVTKPAPRDVAQGTPTPQTKSMPTQADPAPRRTGKRGLPSASDNENE